MKKRIVLCADDYGQGLNVSQGILHLLGQRRLTAVSCLVNASFWPLHAGWLSPYTDKVDIGLHLNLTEGVPLSPAFIQRYGARFTGLSSLLKKALLGRMNLDLVRLEFEAQMQAFTLAMGRSPDFIDGHQHIHQLPGIRSMVVEVYERFMRSQKSYVRLANPSLSWIDFFRCPKKIAIKNLGARAFERLLAARALPHNRSFSGIYAFNNASTYRNHFLGFLKEVGDQGMIMCHPGYVSDNDRISEARHHELKYFESSDFIADCETHHIHLQRFDAGV